MHEEEYHKKTVNMSQWRENDGKYRRSGGKRLYYGKWKWWLKWVIPPLRRRLMFTRGFSTFCQSQHCIGNISCQTVHLVRYSVWQRAERLTGQPPWLSLSNNTRSSRPTGDSVLTTQSMYRHPENVCLRCSCINSLQVNALYSVTLEMKTFGIMDADMCVSGYF